MEKNTDQSADDQHGVTRMSNGRKSTLRGVAIVGVLCGFGLSGTFLLADSMDQKIKDRMDAVVADFEADSGLTLTYESYDISSSFHDSGWPQYLRPEIELSLSDVVVSDPDGIKPSVLTISQLSITAPFEKVLGSEEIPGLGGIQVDGMIIHDPVILSELESNTDVDYSDRKLNLSASYRYSNDDQQSLQLSVGQALADMNSISISAVLTGMGEFWGVANQAYQARTNGGTTDDQLGDKLLKSLTNGLFKSLTFSYTNLGEVEAYYQNTASETEQTVSDVKAQLIQAVESILEVPAQRDPLKAFVEQPGSLTISLAPAEPIVMAELPALVLGAGMGQPQTVLDQLNVTISSN